MNPSIFLATIALAACAACIATSEAAAAPVKRPARRATAHASTAPARTSASAAPVSGPRRLDDIHIEGEIPVPQVLFVSAREQRRFLDFQQSRWLRSARQLGESTPVPTTVIRSTIPVTRAEETHR